MGDVVAWIVFSFGVVLACGIYVLWTRVTFVLPPPLGPLRTCFVQSNDQGNFGELLTAVILTQQGWRQLPSKLGGGGHGIDGLFVRPRLLGFAVLITETKTNVSRYRDSQLENRNLIRTIGELYTIGEMSWQIADEIIRGLKYRSPHIRKECWRHIFENGQTLVRRANRKGKLARRTATRDHAHLMESLTMMLSIFDRDGHYLRTTQD